MIKNFKHNLIIVFLLCFLFDSKALHQMNREAFLQIDSLVYEFKSNGSILRLYSKTYEFLKVLEDGDAVFFSAGFYNSESGNLNSKITLLSNKNIMLKYYFRDYNSAVLNNTSIRLIDYDIIYYLKLQNVSVDLKSEINLDLNFNEENKINEAYNSEDSLFSLYNYNYGYGRAFFELDDRTKWKFRKKEALCALKGLVVSIEEQKGLFNLKIYHGQSWSYILGLKKVKVKYGMMVNKNQLVGTFSEKTKYYIMGILFEKSEK